MAKIKLTSLLAGAMLLASASTASATVTFTEVGESAGIRFVHDSLGFRTADNVDIQDLYGPGVGIEDINNDGWLDIFITNGIAGNRLFLNNGDWTFTDVSEAMKVSVSRVANGLAFGDLDNNGLVDFAVGNFYAQPHLYKHQQDRFADTASLMGLVPLLPSDGVFNLDPESMGVSFADYNHDGYLDIYVANYRDQQDVLYDSRGGTFWQYNDSVQVTYSGYGFQAVFLDFDGDGDLDIYVANDFGYNFMFRNMGPEADYAFEEVALAHGIAGGGTSTHLKGMSMGLAVGDYDNDLDLDIFVTNFQLNSFYRNDGPGIRPGIWKWTEVAAELGVEYPINCWGTDFVDLDNDTNLDLVQASGYIYEVRFNQPYANPDQVWMNNGPELGYTFTNITEGSGFGSTEMARGLATGDLDRDGDVDVVIVNNTFYDPVPSAADVVVYEGWSQVYRNDQKSGNNWVNLKLEGSFGRTPGARSNRSAVGARVWLTTTAGLTMMREIQAGASFMSHNSLEVEFGLGLADVAEVRVRWPGGAEETFAGVRANRFWNLREMEGIATPISFALNRFEALLQTDGVRVTWSSAPSSQIVTATLERRPAAGQWTAIAVLQGEAARSGVIWDESPPDSGNVDYRLVLVEDDGLETTSGIATFDFGGGTAPPLPSLARLGQNFPNPFNPSTRIEFELPRAERATVRIFDPRGRLVRTLFDAEGMAGANSVDWDGTGEEGEILSSGVYHYQLVTPNRTESRRMVLVR